MDYAISRSQKYSRHDYLIFMPLLVFLSVYVIGCSQQLATFTPEPNTLEFIEPTSEPTLAVTFTPQLLSPPFIAWADPSLPEFARGLISDQPEFDLSTTKEQALLTFSAAKSEHPIGSWTYLLVAPLYSNFDNVQFSDLSSFWSSGPNSDLEISSLFMSEESNLFLSQFWGTPFADGLSIFDNELILDEIWYDPTALAIIPFDQLEPSYKVISVDNHNPLTSYKDDDSYLLTFPIYLSMSDPALLQPFQVTDISNFDSSKLTSVVLTGVTAMVRDTAVIMERPSVKGVPQN